MYVKDDKRGAALIITISVMTVLLLVALLFFTISRAELKTATNVTNTYRAELLANGALAIAMATLQHDLAIHPTVTSTDHEWRTRFNHAWAAGKPWAWRGGIPITGGGVPEVDMDQDTDPATPGIQPVFVTASERDQLYIPRVQGATYADARNFTRAFAITNDYGISALAQPITYTYQVGVDSADNPVYRTVDFAGPLLPNDQLHFINDVDNDEDGLKDSAWFPMPADKFFSDDGIDNDLDGTIDEPDEPGTFVYWGGDDGLDNDGINGIDDPGERRFFLTAPIVKKGGVPFSPFPVAYDTTRYDTARYPLFSGTLDPTPGSPDVDKLDNDHNQIRNDHEEYSYVAANVGARAADMQSDGFDNDEDGHIDEAGEGEKVIQARFKLIGPLSGRPAFDAQGNPVVNARGVAGIRVVTGTGEPVCDIVGRAAVLITDESSKVNLNAAGGHRFTPETLGTPGVFVTRAISDGATPYEYETLMLPAIGGPRGQYLWEYLMGAPRGQGLKAVVAGPDPDVVPPGVYDFDISFPGYGRVDDNGDALWLMMDGIDNDGDGLIDEVNEGIDEPGEFRLYRPYRNTVAEDDGVANHPDREAIDAIGELGDRALKTGEQIQAVEQIGPGTFNALKNLITVHSTDKNDRHRYFYLRENDGIDNDGDGIVDEPDEQGIFPLDPISRTTSGLKLDYNYAAPDTILQALQQDWGYVPFQFPVTGVFPNNANEFFAGLRQPIRVLDSAGGAGIMGGFATILSPTPGLLAADPELRAGELAVNVKDSRDTDHATTEIKESVEDEWWTSAVEKRRITYTQRGVESIRINEIMVRPVRRVEAEATTTSADPDYRSAFDPIPRNPATGVPYAPFPEFDVRRIYIKDRSKDPISPEIPEIRDSLAQAGWDRMGNVIGEAAFLQTDMPQFEVTPPGFPTLTIPNAVQFRFGPSNGLPPGRYYLVINTKGQDGVPTVTPADTNPIDSKLKYAIKYVSTTVSSFNGKSVGVSSILEDVIQDARYGTNVVPWNPLPSAEYVNANTGSVFLATRDNPVAHVDPLKFGYDQDNAFTVEIPPLAANTYLCVAIRLMPGFTGPLSINFFDFSQEPDHEWVEVVNIAKRESGEQPIDLSGWQLVVGGVNDNGDVVTGDKIVMTIPEGTQIAPGGSLLLGTDKYDNFQNTDTVPLLNRNGIGLARGIVVGADIAGNPIPYSYTGVTVPPLAMDSNLNLLNSVFAPPAPPAGQVFYKDFIDANFDGVADTVPTPDDTVRSTDDIGADANSADKAWDRIVLLEIPDLLAIGNDVGKLAERVLRGGIFPNDPEHDRIDNDFDNNVLEADRVDNDGDFVDDLTPNSIDEPGEGVDEGRYFIDTGKTTPGAFSSFAVDYAAKYVLPTASDILFAFVGLPPENIPPGPIPSYLGAISDAPDWKEFVERRWYPGDCVVITLYEGDAAKKRIADRVTYTERDVINRAIDDSISCDLDVPSNGIDADEQTPLNFLQPYWTYWPDNSMGIDFYVSLQRKHPLYAGDRFGTQNRWQATDGNYDDWEHGIPATSLGVNPVLAAANPLLAASVPRRFFGSPLQRNLSQDSLEGVFKDPYRPLWAFGKAGVRNRNYTSTGDLVALPELAFAKEYEINGLGGYATVDSVDGVLLGQADAKDLTAVMSSAANSNLTLTAAQADVIFPISVDADPTNDTVLPNANPWEPTGALLPEAWMPVFLFPIFVLSPPPPLQREVQGDPDDFVFSPGVKVNIRRYFLFQPPEPVPGRDPFHVTIAGSMEALLQRWPLENREIMYVSGNLGRPGSGSPPFNPTLAHTNSAGATAVYFWDGDDGLENGEYDVYVGIAEDLTPLRQAVAASAAANSGAQTLLTDPFGGQLMNYGTSPTNVAVDVEFATDLSGDRQIAFDPLPLPPASPDPNYRYRDPADKYYGMQTAVRPDTDGFVHYGVVRVENNRLAMKLRNWSERGQLVRFSRVILTPRDRTPGRININTAETRFTQTGGDDYYANPLLGIPGVLVNPNTGRYPSDPAPTQLPTDTSPPMGIASRILQNRTPWVDGRYYTSPSDFLAQKVPVTLEPPDGYVLYPPILSSINDPGFRYDELAFRYSRMANLITTRSDVFQIIVTAQSGYVSNTDLSGDGRIDYRNDFVVTAEKKTSTVYER